MSLLDKVKLNKKYLKHIIFFDDMSCYFLRLGFKKKVFKKAFKGDIFFDENRILKTLSFKDHL